MVRRRGLVVVVLLLSLVVAACTPQELGEIFADQDLRTSENPAEAAAGHVATATETDQAAQQLVDEGLREKDRDKLVKAWDQRRQDARYAVYLVAQAYADGTVERFWSSLYNSASLYLRERDPKGDASTEEVYGDWLLVVLGALDQALSIEYERTPREPDRIERLEEVFCATKSFYLRDYGPSARDVFDLVFLAETECTQS